MIKSKAHRVFERGIPETFSALCAVHLPRPIHDEAAREKTLEIIRALAGLDLNEDQEDYFEALAIFVNEYEKRNDKSLPKGEPVEVLRYLMEENNISGRELGRILGKNETLGAKILSGDRKITVEHAKKLSERFGVKASAFLGV